MSFLETLLDGNNARERKKKQLCAIAISVTALALVIALIAFAICQVVGISTTDGEEKETAVEEETVDLGETKVIELSEKAVTTGNLLTLNDNNRYKGEPDVINFEDERKKYEAENGGGKSGFISLFDNKDIFEATPDTINAVCKMVTDCNNALSDDNLVLLNAYFVNNENNKYSSGETVEIGFCFEGKTNVENRISIAEDEKYDWIYDNAYKYGFIAESAKSGVFRYVGKLHATAAKYNGLYLNNYLKALKNATVESPLKLNESGSCIAYTCSINDVKVPVNYSYEISGNNVDGVIVTVNLSKSATQNTAQ